MNIVIRGAVQTSLLVAVNLATLGCTSSLKFTDLSVDPPSSVIDRLRADRKTVSSTSMFLGDLRSLVGLVVIVPSGGDPSARIERLRSDPSLRPDPALLQDDITSQELYRGRVQGKVDVGGIAGIVKSDNSSESISEVLIEDALRIGYRDLRQIPFDKIRTYALLPGFDYYFVEAVILTRSTSRVFNKFEGRTLISAPAFGANGGVYVASDATQRDWMTSLTMFDLRSTGLRAGGEGSGIFSSARTNVPMFDPASEEKLRDYLNVVARESASKVNDDLSEMPLANIRRVY